MLSYLPLNPVALITRTSTIAVGPGGPDAALMSSGKSEAEFAAATTRKLGRRSMAGNKRTSIMLQERDLRLLEALDSMRVIDREQASVVAGFRSRTRANERLLALTQAGYL